MLLAEGALNYESYAQLWDRAVVLSATAVVRLRGDDPTRPEAPAKQNLDEAEQRFREVLAATPKAAPSDGASTNAKTCKCSSGSSAVAKPAQWKSRHGEGLVALGRYQQAFDLLVTMLPASSLAEAEGAAALARAAHELTNAEVAAAADARCKTLAKQRAKQVCRDSIKAAGAR